MRKTMLFMGPGPRRRGRPAGFSLVEIMIVVALMSLIAALAMPSFIRGRKRAQASRLLDDLRAIDSAMEQYSIEEGKADGETIAWADITKYIKSGSKLANSEGKDLLGNHFLSLEVGKVPRISDATAEALSDVTSPEFWSPFR